MRPRGRSARRRRRVWRLDDVVKAAGRLRAAVRGGGRFGGEALGRRGGGGLTSPRRWRLAAAGHGVEVSRGGGGRCGEDEPVGATPWGQRLPRRKLCGGRPAHRRRSSDGGSACSGSEAWPARRRSCSGGSEVGQGGDSAAAGRVARGGRPDPWQRRRGCGRGNSRWRAVW